MTIALYILAAMWAIGALGGAAVLAYTLSESWPARAIWSLILIPVWALAGLGPLLIIHSETGPVLATLQKSEWVCAASHTSTSTSYVMVGRVATPVTSESQVCDQYVRRGAQ